MYYTMSEHQAIGQVHSKGRNKGYHFTWTMLPLDFCNFATQALYKPCVVGGGKELSMNEFIVIVEKAVSQSFEEGIE